MICAPLSAICALRLRLTCAIKVIDFDFAKFLIARADARIGQQIVNQSLHSLRAIDSVADELIGARVKLALVAALQQLHATADGTQWFLQIVRGDIGEMAQFFVGALQF